MTNLECNVKNCYYNKSSKCCRDGINVEGQELLLMQLIVGILKRRLRAQQHKHVIVVQVRRIHQMYHVKLRIVYLMIILSAMRTKLQFQVMEQSMKVRQNVEALNVVVSRINLFFCNCASTYEKIELQNVNILITWIVTCYALTQSTTKFAYRKARASLLCSFGTL